MSTVQEIEEQIKDMKDYLPKYKDNNPEMYQKIKNVIDNLEIQLLIAQEQEDKEEFYK
nr:MAG TPA: hypothetical protein [Caudoviricetes sp.]